MTLPSTHRSTAAISVAALLLAALLPALRGGYWADEPEARPSVEARSVYFGAPSAARLPAVVHADSVYARIPAYLRIRTGRLTERDPEYWLRMREAASVFRGAVAEAARIKGRDLVAERGSVAWGGRDVPDITGAVLDALPGTAPRR